MVTAAFSVPKVRCKEFWFVEFWFADGRLSFSVGVFSVSASVFEHSGEGGGSVIYFYFYFYFQLVGMSGSIYGERSL